MIVQPLELRFKSGIGGAELYYGKNMQFLGIVNIPLEFYSDEKKIRMIAIAEIKYQIERFIQDNHILGMTSTITNPEKFKLVGDNEKIDLQITSNGDIVVL
ncbi:MAG: hypothetical protein FWG92_06470 [Leptospirales bacterium]|nr:hypothetical protein [Leptospirales bacterium]